MKISSKLLGALTVGAFSLVFAQGVHAQQQEGLVNVNLSDIAVTIAEDINVNVSQIPVIVQAPIGIAANVCDVNANVLARQVRDGGAECDAQTTSTALNQVVQRQLLTQE